jgi:outer membrane lipoprotein-sorting protein
MKKVILLISVLFITAAAFSKPTNEAKVIIEKMLVSIDKLKTLSYTMKGWERLNDGKDQYSEIDAKLNVKPQKIYIHSKAEPNKGVQIIYNEEFYGKKAYVNAGKFIPNLKLEPFSSRMRDKQHHTILNTGFSTLGNIIKNALQRAEKEAKQEDFDKFLKYEGEITWNNINCYKITITDPTFSYINYTVKEGDDVESLERSKFICGYLIIDKNENVKDFWSLKSGMVIKIPSSYAKKTTLYIDKNTMLPIYQVMSDESKQFEKYEFYNVKVNPTFKETDFKDFP